MCSIIKGKAVFNYNRYTRYNYLVLVYKYRQGKFDRIQLYLKKPIEPKANICELVLAYINYRGLIMGIK